MMKQSEIKKVSLILLTVWLCMVSSVLPAQKKYNGIFDEFFAQDRFKGAQAGVVIADTKTGQVLYELNHDKLFIPASVLKLVTTATAVEILGPEYRFETQIGYTGTIERGVLKGDLIIVGGGDPTLGSEYFTSHYYNFHFLKRWAEQIKAAGIRSI